LLTLFSSSLFFGQIDPEESILTPDGLFDIVYDQNENTYRLKDLLIEKYTNPNATLRATLLNCTTTSYFNLYFEDGSGMETVVDPIQNAINTSRRNVVCKVFEDISNFIQSPLSNPGNTTKVNIWVRNLNNIVFPTVINYEVLGLATSFYCIPFINNPLIGGIADGEIWKTIHLGVDSYTNISAPIASTNPLGPTSGPLSQGNFFHGMIAFNFNADSTLTSDPIIWNTDLNVPASSTQYDLYANVLKEVTSALGFSSLIKPLGLSKFGANFPYYSRYDQFLTNNNQTKNLIISSSTCSPSTSMYNYRFNPDLNTLVLNPYNSGLSCYAVYSDCLKALYYKSLTVIAPIFTFNAPCYNPRTTFGRFDDRLYPTCGTPYGVNNYFAMTVLQSMDSLGTKRYLKPEERNVLCDIGYKVNTNFGSSTIPSFNSSAGLYGSSVCNGIDVAGLNDGLNPNGTYSFIIPQGVATSLLGSQFLNNDFNATSFECLENLSASGTLSLTSGNASTIVNFNSSVAGINLLRYVPVSISGARGNITYVFIYVVVPNSTVNSVACNNEFVTNGDFELNYQVPNSISRINYAVNWETFGLTSPDYFAATSTTPIYDVPCNRKGFEKDKILVNSSYAGFYFENDLLTSGISFNEMFKTRLNAPLLPNTVYILKFDISRADVFSRTALKIKAIVSASDISGAFISLPYPILGGTVFTTDYIQNSSGWDAINVTFNTGSTANYQYLYFGFDLDSGMLNTLPAANIPTCASTINISGNPNTFNKVYYYIDNVSLSAVNNGTFTLPATYPCSPQLLTNLSVYLANLPTPSSTNSFSLVSQPAGSTATANTIQNVSGQWNFNTAGLISGNYTIRYTYTDAVGCVKTIDSSIFIEPCDVLVANVRADATQYYLGCYYIGQTGSAYIFPNCTINGLVATYPRAFATQVNASIPGVSITPSGYLSLNGSAIPPGTYTIIYKICQTSQPLNCSNTASFQFTISPQIQANDDDIIVDPFGNMSISDGRFLSSYNICKNDFRQCGLLNPAEVTLSAVSTSPAFTLNLTTRQITLANNLPIGNIYSMIYRVSLNSNPTIYSDATIYVNIISTIGLGANSRVLTTDYINGASPKILITGDFTKFSGYDRKNIASLNQTDLNQAPFSYATAYLGPKHLTLSTNLIQKVCVDGASAYLGGQFTGYTSSPSNRIVKITTSNGIKDMSFGASMNNTVYDIKKIPGTSNQILVAGSFDYTYGSGNKRGIARLSSVTGALDTSFNNPVAGANSTGANGIIDCMAIQTDGKIIITGNFTSYNGTTTGNGIARLNANGTLDITFNIGGLGFNNVIVAGATEANFKKILIDSTPQKNIFICGAFNTYNGSQAQNIVKIKSSGVIDPFFIGKANSKINDMTFVNAVQSFLYIGGQFSSYDGFLEPARRKLTKISTNNGNRDLAFGQPYYNEQFNGIVYTTTLQPDNRLIVGGAFTKYKDFTANYITRIEPISGNQGRASNIETNETIFPNEILIYPNPSNSIFNLDLNNNNQIFENYSVHNILGQKIINQKIINNNINEINLENYPNGFYILSLENLEKTIDFKLIKN
jgi:Domain of unknown function (DUF5122) beta-propeller/Secretion system C-terminal sorting domain